MYIVKDGVVITPQTDHQILPGITRLLLLNILRADGSIAVVERAVSREELGNADEVWLSSSTKEIAPVTAIDDVQVGDGQPGPVWQQAQTLFSRDKYQY